MLKNIFFYYFYAIFLIYNYKPQHQRKDLEKLLIDMLHKKYYKHKTELNKSRLNNIVLY